MEDEGWIVASSRKNKKKKKTGRQEKEIEKTVPRAGETTLTCPQDGETALIYQKDGESGQSTSQFPMDGNPTRKALLQTLAVLLQQAGLVQ